MGLALRKEDIYITPSEYLAGERMSEIKHEYLAGIVHAMSSVSRAHARITGNIQRELGNQLRGKRCEVFGPDIKVHLNFDAREFFYYPDVSVDCSGAGDPHAHFIESPTLIFEVLSPSTERIDCGEKLSNYLRLPSLAAYTLVAQSNPAVTVHRRTTSGWDMEFYGEMSTVVTYREIDSALPLAAIYERMGF
jgi:Uma2 family endonuclease